MSVELFQIYVKYLHKRTRLISQDYCPKASEIAIFIENTRVPLPAEIIYRYKIKLEFYAII